MDAAQFAPQEPTTLPSSTSIEILGRQFKDLGQVVLELNEEGSPREFAPQLRYAKANSFKLHKYGEGNYCKFRVAGLPQTSGVYIFSVDGNAVYVGKAANLFKRFYMGYGNISPKNCYEGGQQTNCRINQLVLAVSGTVGVPHILIHECADHDSFESSLIAVLKPRWNLTK